MLQVPGADAVVEQLCPQLDVALSAASVQLERVKPQSERGVDVACITLEPRATIMVAFGAAVPWSRSAIAVVAVPAGSSSASEVLVPSN